MNVWAAFNRARPSADCASCVSGPQLTRNESVLSVRQTTAVNPHVLALVAASLRLDRRLTPLGAAPGPGGDHGDGEDDDSSSSDESDIDYDEEELPSQFWCARSCDGPFIKQ